MTSGAVGGASQRGRLVAMEKWTDSRANGSATSGSAFIQSVLEDVQDGASRWRVGY